MELTSSTATWPVVRGSLKSCLFVESSSCPLDQSFATSVPLILERPSPYDPHSAPCDVTVVFPKKYEIKQIYVRSTARIYEIYYATSSTSQNEYLCTVRCSPAEVSLAVADDNEAFKETDTQFATETSSGSSNISTSDDSWVDISKSNDSNITKINVSPPRTNEDLYEATAGISDADPCISLTIRLLSVQSYGYVCVDEIYVFGDPVDDDNDDSEGQKNPVGSVARNSLMALLAPMLLLQQSKSSIGSIVNNSNSKQPGDKSSRYSGSHRAALMTDTHENLPESTPLASNQQAETYHAGSVPTYASEPEKSHVSNRIQDEAPSHNFTPNEYPNRIEESLKELISRVIKIEEMCSSFVEKIQKPICSIEERLSLVEQQLSALSMNSQNSKISSGTRFYAPDWSCIESASNPSDVDESNLSRGTANTPKFPSITLPSQPPGSESSVLMDNTEVLPSPLSTSPQNTNHDAGDTDPSIHFNDTSPEQPKKTVSIDDALASALAAFMSLDRPQTLTRAFSIKAPDYSTSEEIENKNVHSSPSQNAQITSLSIYGDGSETEVTRCEQSSTFISNNVAQEVPELLHNDTSSDQIKEKNKGSSLGKIEGISLFINGKDLEADKHKESSSSVKFAGEVQYEYDEDAQDIHKHVKSESNEDSVILEYTSEEGKHLNDFTHLRLEHEVDDHQQRARNGREAINLEALLQVIELAHMPPTVDLNASVLDVTFVSGKISNTNSSSLEALLTDATPGDRVEVPHDAEVGSGGDASTYHDFISQEKETSSFLTSDLTVNMHHFDKEPRSIVMENNLNEDDLHSHLSHEDD